MIDPNNFEESVSNYIITVLKKGNLIEIIKIYGTEMPHEMLRQIFKIVKK
jgi:hypothetical protein